MPFRTNFLVLGQKVGRISGQIRTKSAQNLSKASAMSGHETEVDLIQKVKICLRSFENAFWDQKHVKNTAGRTGDDGERENSYFGGSLRRLEPFSGQN